MKKKVPNVQTIITETSSFLLIILFAYSGVSKLLEFQNFQAQLGQSPLLSAYTEFISYTVIGVEFLLVVLLAIPKCRYLGLLSSYGLMLVFTFYIVVILNYSSFIPCSCGGILENMSWKEHLIFNTIFSILPVIPLVINTNKQKKLFVLLAIIMAVSLNTVVILYLKSEKTMHSENPFIRRFIQGAANKIGEINLENFSKYLAGTDDKTIYLGDYKAPLYLVAVDTALTKQQQIKIQLEREDFPFASVQIRITPPYFFLIDGTVPVIYRGKIADWKGKLIFSNNNYYFSKAEILNANNIVFRAQQQKNFENILGIFHFDDSLKVDYKPQLLQKQIDGFFDTDGSLIVDKTTNKFIYTYYYRNQFIVTDDNLQLLHRQNTIDTTSKAKLKVVYLKETKQRKIASIPTTVNQITAVSNNLLFINSTLRGKFEPIEMWKQASIVDVYDIQSKTYLSSIYVYHANKEKLKAMLVINNNLYCLIGNQLHQYQLSKKHFKRPNRN